jgi:hypothetical protein
MNEQDETEYPAIEMEDAPALALQRDREPLPLQQEVEDEIYNPAVEIDEPMPELEHQSFFPIERTGPPLGIQMELEDEVYNPEIEMQEPPPRVELTHTPAVRAEERAALEYENRDSPSPLTIEWDPEEVEMQEPPPRVELTRTPAVRAEERAALEYENHDSPSPLAIRWDPEELEDEFHPEPIEPYQVNFPPSSASDTEDDRGQRALRWSGHPEAGPSRLRPRPVIHEQDQQWLRLKRRAEADSSGEEQGWKVVKAKKADPDYKPPGVQSIQEGYQERQEAEAVQRGAEDLMRETRRIRKLIRQSFLKFRSLF